MSGPRWTVYGVDPAGTPWDILETKVPAEALAKLATLRAEAARSGSGLSNRFYYVYDADEPERGDAEDLLEELVADTVCPDGPSCPDPECRAERVKRACLCGTTVPGAWTAGVHHEAHRCARVVTR